ncbi:MAG: DUF2752 domain-containing protein [Pirellulales bacterium]|nr:DUF2752 domain-containing protein [Pirellulales bacterium]
MGVAHTGSFATFRRTTLPGRVRLTATGLALGLLVLLSLAAWVRPDPRGLGTHQQFGLPPCTFRVLFGLPCPSCGMTTSWAHLVRGQLLGAFQANAGGALLGVFAVLAVPWLLLSATLGRWVGYQPRSASMAWAASAAVLAAVVGWVIRLAMG